MTFHYISIIHCNDLQIIIWFRSDPHDRPKSAYDFQNSCLIFAISDTKLVLILILLLQLMADF